MKLFRLLLLSVGIITATQNTFTYFGPSKNEVDMACAILITGGAAAGIVINKLIEKFGSLNTFGGIAGGIISAMIIYKIARRISEYKKMKSAKTNSQELVTIN